MGRIDRAFAAVFQPIGRAVLLNRNAAACRNRQLRRTVDRGLIADLTAVCVGLVNSVQLQNENMQPAAKGVSRGDTSFSFATAAEQLAALASSGDFLTDWKAQLNAYRKMRW